jgi:hypothetical protein
MASKERRDGNDIDLENDIEQSFHINRYLIIQAAAFSVLRNVFSDVWVGLEGWFQQKFIALGFF